MMERNKASRMCLGIIGIIGIIIMVNRYYIPIKTIIPMHIAPIKYDAPCP